MNMRGLPASTEIHKLIPKKKVYEHFGAEMSAARRKKFDADIARMALVNEVSPLSVNLPVGDTVKNFFVLQVGLKSRDFDPQNIALLARLFGQRLLMVLVFEDQQRLAVWQTRLIMTDWAAEDSIELPFNGLTLERVWENIVAFIAGIEMQQGESLDEQLDAAAQKAKLAKEIERLEKRAWAEQQPKKKMVLKAKIDELKQKLNE